MSIFDEYIIRKFVNEITKLGYDYKLIENYSIWKFRYICYKLNHFLEHIPICKIKQKLFYEAVFIDFRILPNIEFIIRNAILKLGYEWSYTIICGKDNYEYISNIVERINKNIRIICLEYNNITQDEYSKLLTTDTFWNQLYGEKILIYQEDSLIFNNNIHPFLKYDFIGAPFSKSTNDTPNCVGNGGLSLRTKYKMLEVINSCKLDELILNSSTKTYMYNNNLINPPEDVYFSKNMQELSIGDVADWDTANMFSSEQIFNPYSFAGHKFWIGNNYWQNFLKNLFSYKKYNPHSDLNMYLAYKNLPLEFNKNNQISNAFDIDIKFFCHVNNIEYSKTIFTLDYIKNIGLDGFIYHPKQLYNIFGYKICLYKFLNNLYVFYNKTIFTVQDFVNKFIYNTSFDYLANLLIKKKYDTLNDNLDTIFLVFLGNGDLAIDLINRIIEYKKINNEFNIAFCINKNINKNVKEIKNLIKNNFDFYSIYFSSELGTDITPTLLMYNDIIKNHEVKHILKFHTKTISIFYNNLTDYLLVNPLHKIIKNKLENCNCVGHNNSYVHIREDVFNNILKEKYKEYINLNSYFVAGTIFYTKNTVFNKVLDFVKNNNYRSYLLNSLYENNSINHEFSPIHFLERVFGSIKL